jgi:hypothetical protein
MTIEKRLQELEGIIRPNGPRPSGIVIYQIEGAGDLVFETGMQRYYTEAELSELYQEHHISIQIRTPDNGREELPRRSNG